MLNVSESSRIQMDLTSPARVRFDTVELLSILRRSFVANGAELSPHRRTEKFASRTITLFTASSLTIRRSRSARVIVMFRVVVRRRCEQISRALENNDLHDSKQDLQ